MDAGLCTDPITPSLEEWRTWSSEEIARWVSDCSEPLVIGWPFDGTQHWYLKYSRSNEEAENYVDVIVREQAEKHRMLFELGTSVIMAPCFGYESLRRGESYTHEVAKAIFRLGEDPVNTRMFEEGVRVLFYGDYASALDTSALRPMLDSCHELEERTRDNDGPLLLLGLFADEPYSSIARMSVDFYREHGYSPDRRELIREYYGTDVPDLSFYIAFNRPELFDVPLVSTGQERLYATALPSPEVTEWQLRVMLYDHLIVRPAEIDSYEDLSSEAIDKLQRYSDAHKGETIGVGQVDETTGMWRPLITPELSQPERELATYEQDRKRIR